MTRVIAGSAAQTCVDVWELFRLAGNTEQLLLLEAENLRLNLVRGDWRGGTTNGSGPVRCSFVANTSSEALRAIQNVRAAKGFKVNPKVAFLFPGLGEESTDRMSELAGLKGLFRVTLDEANGIVQQELGVTLADLMLKSTVTRSTAAARLLRGEPLVRDEPFPTAYAHASLFTFECALSRTWIEWGVEPSFVLGYSLGEYAAACTAGVFAFADGLRLLIRRAEILRSLPRTGLLAIEANSDELSGFLGHGLYIVAVNGPEQTIVGGDMVLLDNLAQTLRTEGRSTRRLGVEFAFHTPLLADAQDALEEAFSAVRTRPPKYPIISTRTGGLIPPDSVRDPRHWARHLCEPITFQAAINTLLVAGADISLEVGPGQSLNPLLHDLDSKGQATTIASMPAAFDDRAAGAQLLKAAGQLWALGVPLDHPIGLTSPGKNPTTLKTTALAANLTSTIMRIWAAALKRTEVGPDDNLFTLGTSSLTTARIALLIKQELQIDLSVREIFASPSPRLLASVIAEGRREQAVLDELLMLPNGLSIRYQSRAEAIYFYKSIFKERCYFRHGINLRPSGIVLDVGANIGIFSIFAALEEPTAKIYSFEPVPPLFDILKFNLFDISEEASAFNIGLSNCSGNASITYYPESPGMSSFSPNAQEEQKVLTAILQNSRDCGDELAEAALLQGGADFIAHRLRSETFNVPLKTISQLMREQTIDRVDLLKIDVQKLEMDVLQGIDSDDWGRIRQIVAEVHDVDDRVRRVRTILNGHGFGVFVEQDNLYQSTNIFNVFAIREP